MNNFFQIITVKFHPKKNSIIFVIFVNFFFSFPADFFLSIRIRIRCNAEADADSGFGFALQRTIQIHIPEKKILVTQKISCRFFQLFLVGGDISASWAGAPPLPRLQLRLQPRLAARLGTTELEASGYIP